MMLHSTLSLFAYGLLSSKLALAAPLFGIGDRLSDSDATSATPDDVLNGLIRPAQFSRVAYCSSAAVTSWQCGPPCDALGNDIDVFQAGGDDGLVPMYFIAHDPSQDTIVVAHQGTEPENFLSVLNDVQFFLEDLNTTRFTSAEGKDIQVHNGFQKTFERTADGVLSGVLNGLATKGASKILVTGHSLGAAIASLDAMMLKQEVDPSIEITTALFGLPRVGNQEWADFVDEQLGGQLTRVSNQDDPVPIVPPRTIGFRHPSGEIHINAVDDNGEATDVVTCEGQENSECSAGNTVLTASVSNHLGPYFDDISFGGDACPL
ncbi:hypothetical protein D9758_001176 [Tetrapyrgos nigripes]|uniref:Fungal lipase-type domain-containing protein n=1 Tax=Tetrapyrgos nigripes TaxID=182062 RepID=A0A8H5LTU7_9AGAR|nr:hypothetical protein D9758_001176 [Tetrapyrgos nigripes]